jgi:hypothetical protein
MPSQQDLLRHDAKGEDVGFARELPTCGLLGGHVSASTPHHSCRSDVVERKMLGNAKVDQNVATVVSHHDVLGLYIPMDDAVFPKFIDSH